MNATENFPFTTAAPLRLHLQTGARLHAGIFSDQRPGGRRFQGFGMMIDRPGFAWKVTPAEAGGHRVEFRESAAELDAAEQTEIQQRILGILELLDARVDRAARQPLVFQVTETIPRHAGLGSGTQLALAVGRSWNTFHAPVLNTVEISRILGRGGRSCVGTFGFDRGGLLIDRGCTAPDERGECRFAASLPEHYRFVLATPQGLAGLAGPSEREAFRRLPAISDTMNDRFAALLDQIEPILPDFDRFSEVLREFGLLAGESFAAIQGGRFMHSRCEEVFSAFEQCGLRGIAQSSWGPTMFALCADEESAAAAQQHLAQTVADITLRVVQPRNFGAVIEPAF